MKFKEVDKHTEELIKASSFFAKIKGKDEKTMNLLENSYRKDITNYDNVLTLCFYQWFLADDKLNLADTNSIFQITFDVINKIEDTLNDNPDYWILWILKYKIISFMNFNEEELLQNLIELTRLQDLEEQKPYYITTEILLAHVYYSKGYIAESVEVMDKVLEKYNSKVTILTEFFKGYAIEFRNLLLRSGEDQLLNRVNTVIDKYF